MAEKHRPALIPVPVPPAGISMNPASSANMFRSYPMSYPSAQASFERGSLGSAGGHVNANGNSNSNNGGNGSGATVSQQAGSGGNNMQQTTTAATAQQAMYDPVRASSGSASFVPNFDGDRLADGKTETAAAAQKRKRSQERGNGAMQAQQGSAASTATELHHVAAANAFNHNNQFLPHYDQGVASPTDEVMGGMKQDGQALTKTHVCDHCNARFTRLHNLKSHLLTHTSSKKEFTCSDCGSEFRRLHDLKRHQKLHTGEKPFACDLCGRRFARADALGRHTKSASTEGNCANTPRKYKSEPGSLHASQSAFQEAELQAIVAANAGGSHSTPNPLRSLTQIDTSFAPREEFLQQQAESSDGGSGLQHAVGSAEEAGLTGTTGRGGPHFNNDHILEAQLVASPGGLSPQDGGWAMRYEQLLQEHQALQRQFAEMAERLKQLEARNGTMQ